MRLNRVAALTTPAAFVIFAVSDIDPEVRSQKPEVSQR
jgi:hypothetical protein